MPLRFRQEIQAVLRRGGYSGDALELERSAPHALLDITPKPPVWETGWWVGWRLDTDARVCQKPLGGFRWARWHLGWLGCQPTRYGRLCVVRRTRRGNDTVSLSPSPTEFGVPSHRRSRQDLARSTIVAEGYRDDLLLPESSARMSCGFPFPMRQPTYSHRSAGNLGPTIR